MGLPVAAVVVDGIETLQTIIEIVGRSTRIIMVVVSTIMNQMMSVNVISKYNEPTMDDIIEDTTDSLSNMINIAIREQQTIGWKQFFLGRVTKQWSRVQEEYLRHSTTISSQGPYSSVKAYNKWRSTFLIAILQYSLDLWSERNTHVHGDTPQNQRFLKRKKAIEKAREKFLEGEDTVPI